MPSNGLAAVVSTRKHITYLPIILAIPDSEQGLFGDTEYGQLLDLRSYASFLRLMARSSRSINIYRDINTFLYTD